MVHASLFSGIGGPEVAAEMMGWTNAFHCEINPFGRKVLEYWYPESKSYDDITKTDFTPWRGKIDILTGGFPCQPFSYAGKRGGADDNRYLWPQMLRAIDEIRPAWVVGENVAGITTMVEGGVCTDMGGEATLWGEGDGVHRYALRETFTIERICRDLESHGYSVQPLLIPAAACGAPHRRDRIFILAYADDAYHNNTVRGAGKDAGESSEERVCKRDEVQRAGVADSIRREVARAIADTYLQRCNQPKSPEEPGEAERFNRKAHSRWGDGSLRPERRWATFPTVSPVCRGDDGLSLSAYHDSIYEKRNSMDRTLIIKNALDTGKIEVDFETGEIFSSRIRGHEGERILLSGSECNGYIVHTLSFNGAKKQCRAHQIVWIAANGLYDKSRLQIDHINRNRKDNRLCNLRLVTAAENIANSERKDIRKLKDNERLEIWQLYNEGNMSLREIAEDYGVSKSLVHNIVKDFRTDDLTVSPNYWRTESLKAYGNAIVPQVMFRIFQAIEYASSN